MIQNQGQKLTLEAFFALPEGDVIYEFVDGQAVPKFNDYDITPKFFYSSITEALFILLDQWSRQRGRVQIRWAVSLTYDNQPWVPVPDLAYISFARLPTDWMKDEACPLPPELVIEIISLEQTFGEVIEKATNYLKAGVSRVWIIDSQAKSITTFTPDASPKTYRSQMKVTDSLLPELSFVTEQIFQ